MFTNPIRDELLNGLFLEIFITKIIYSTFDLD